MTFSGDGQYLLSGGVWGVQVWRVKDDKQMATLEAEDVESLAVSKDRRWIVAVGTGLADVFVWDTKTYEKVILRRDPGYNRTTRAVDFSPDSTRLVSASDNKPTSIWDPATRNKVQTLDHKGKVTLAAAKYSPQGDRIATATRESVRVWDTNDGRLLVHIPVTATINTGLFWSNNHLFVASDNKIKEFKASTGSVILEWSVANTNSTSSIDLPQHQEFVACSTKRTVNILKTYVQLHAH